VYVLEEKIKMCFLVEHHIIHVRLVIYGAVMVADKKVKTLGENRWAATHIQHIISQTWKWMASLK